MTSQPRPHRQAAGDEAGGLQTHGLGVDLKQGSFSLDPAHPLGFFLRVVGLVVERPKANLESLEEATCWLNASGWSLWVSPGFSAG